MRHWRLLFMVALAGAPAPGAVLGCGSGTGGNDHSGNDAGPDASPTGQPTTGPTGTGPADAPDSGAVVGQIDGGVQTKLPMLAPLANVFAKLNDDSASITFDPVDGALDYRVYPLPSDGDINVATDGHVVVHNGIYRCAGNRETRAPTVDDGAAVSGSGIHTQVDQQTVGGFKRTLAGATLGYVYTQPGAGLVPVYAMGESNAQADSTCFFARWAASRVKKYTTSQTERTQLLSTFARDDGIAFYVPAASDGTTTQVYVYDDQPGTQYTSRFYFAAGAEGSAHSSKTAAFPVLTNQAPGTSPLMRVFYQNSCGWSHDELAVGKERFNRIYKQGDQLPWWSVLWTGVTAPTTLVVEALDKQCPFQGHLSPQPVAATTVLFGSMPLNHQPFVTIDQARVASPTSEVFVNGQNGPAYPWNGGTVNPGGPVQPAASELPKAIARSFVKVAPQPHPKMDFFADFSPTGTPEAFTTVPCGVAGGNCFATWRQQSNTFDQMFIDIESNPKTNQPLFAYGQVMGELWVTYADVGSDTNGKYRLTPKQKATMASSTFLHATMEVDSYSTTRRYPQIIISDQDAPVQYSLEKGHSLVIQPRAEGNQATDFPVDYQVEVCNLRTWDVNNQCPVYDLYHVGTGTTAHLLPGAELGEQASADHRVVYDVYTSTKRMYLFLDGQPYACADLPSVGVPSGPVTVTWGDVLYHSAVDHNFAFHVDHMQIETRRHFDNLGFSSGLPAPAWNESRFPCAPPITL